MTVLSHTAPAPGYGFGVAMLRALPDETFTELVLWVSERSPGGNRAARVRGAAARSALERVGFKNGSGRFGTGVTVDAGSHSSLQRRSPSQMPSDTVTKWLTGEVVTAR